MMLKHKIVLLVLLFLKSFVVFAQIPTGYYTGTETLTGIALQSKLHDIIKNHQSKSYSSLHTHYQSTDKKPNGKVWDMYSDKPNGTPPYEYSFGNTCGNYNSEGDCYNREHSFPQSWFSSSSPMQSDLFMVYPTDGYVNGKRSSYPFGEVGSTSWSSQNGSLVGSSKTPGYSGTVFEPIDEYKGDFARTYFYMATRYYTEDNGWPGSAMVDGAQPKAWALDLLKKWNAQDTVSQKEIDRNNAVYQIQDNRNPFIDQPEFVSKIWGDIVSVAQKTRVEDFRFNIFPNPAEKIVFLTKCSAGNHSPQINIVDLSGKVIQSSLLSNNPGSSTYMLNISNLAKGYYLVHCNCKSMHRAKLVVF